MPPRGEMAGQDFSTVTFSNKPKPGAAKTGPRPGGATTSSGMSAAKLDAETDELKRELRPASRLHLPATDDCLPCHRARCRSQPQTQQSTTRIACLK